MDEVDSVGVEVILLAVPDSQRKGDVGLYGWRLASGEMVQSPVVKKIFPVYTIVSSIMKDFVNYQFLAIIRD